MPLSGSRLPQIKTGMAAQAAAKGAIARLIDTQGTPRGKWRQSSAALQNEEHKGLRQERELK